MWNLSLRDSKSASENPNLRAISKEHKWNLSNANYESIISLAQRSGWPNFWGLFCHLCRLGIFHRSLWCIGDNVFGLYFGDKAGGHWLFHSGRLLHPETGGSIVSKQRIYIKWFCMTWLNDAKFIEMTAAAFGAKIFLRYEHIGYIVLRES